MNFKKVMVGTLACSMMAAMSVSTFAADDVTAVLTLNDADWAAAASTPVVINGDGEYTITGSFEEAKGLAQFSALEIPNGEEIFGNGVVEIIVTSVVFDGEEVKVADSYTCSADGAGVTTRVNIFNAWNEPDDLNDDSDGYAENRAAGKTADQVSARIVSADYVPAEGGSKTVKDATITFKVVGTESADASGDVAPVAYLAAIVAVAGLAMVASKKRA